MYEFHTTIKENFLVFFIYLVKIYFKSIEMKQDSVNTYPLSIRNY